MARERNNKETLPKMCDAKIPRPNMLIYYKPIESLENFYLPYTHESVRKRTLPNDHLTCRVTISTGAGFCQFSVGKHQTTKKLTSIKWLYRVHSAVSSSAWYCSWPFMEILHPGTSWRWTSFGFLVTTWQKINWAAFKTLNPLEV